MKLSQPTEATVADLLRQKIGLDAIAIGTGAIGRAIHQRMVVCGLANETAYLAQLQASTSELDALIETIVIPETWFFRDREPFVFLTHYVRSEWLPTHPNRVLRVLSVPCATGEEPYSIAIALLEIGLASTQFHIDAVDISHVALSKAQRAVYEQHSFRGRNLVLPCSTGMMTLSTLQQRYFQQREGNYQLSERVTQAVHFIQGNLLDPYFLSGQVHYDVIFCRNLLIYLDHSARKQAIQRLERWLNPDGLLFVGHSEMGQLQTSRFTQVRHPLAFAVRRAKCQVDCSTPPQQIGKNRSKQPVTLIERSKAQRSSHFFAQEGQKKSQEINCDRTSATQPNSSVESASSVSTQADRPESLLEKARDLANRGRLSEAATVCKTYLSQKPLSADGYILLGEIQQATGDEDQAEQCFCKATYLKPSHEEALTFLALLKEQRGDIVGAATIRQRIQRLHKSQNQ